jgi:hypothetical protein
VKLIVARANQSAEYKLYHDHFRDFYISLLQMGFILSAEENCIFFLKVTASI